MDVTVSEKGSSKVAVVISPDVLIGSVQDALDLMATMDHIYGCHKMVISKENIAGDFFDLKTRLAGEILQKYTNYRFKIAIVGDFSVYKSRSLKDFIYESNKGSQVFFLPDTGTAVEKLHGI
jgi:hypothetical protein